MKQQDLILAANSYAINNGDNAFDRKILRAAFKAGAAWFYEEPEPLDPHTCDLMVGDVVEATFDEDGINKLIVVEDMRGGTFNFWNYTERYFMCLPDSAINKLTHRNGATIKEVGNE